jgi:hypothetical protein
MYCLCYLTIQMSLKNVIIDDKTKKLQISFVICLTEKVNLGETKMVDAPGKIQNFFLS